MERILSQPTLLSLNGASVVYPSETGEDRRVWSDISLQIRQGEWLCVTGANGSGKSTLAGVLLGLLPLSGGQLTQAAETIVRGVLQMPDAQFIGDTAGEELAYIPHDPGATTEEITRLHREALAVVGLESIPPDRSLNELSGGQKQLLTIAIALASQPKVLILDEPTAMLDPAARAAVLHAVRQAHRLGTAIVWVTHRLEEAAEAERVIAFSGGGIAFDGSPRRFFYGYAEGKREDATESDDSWSGANEALASPCISLGLEPPFVIRTALSLLQRGHCLQPLPLRADELAEAVVELCR